MPITFVGSAGGNGINATGPTVTLPAGMAIDDLIIVAYAVGDDDFTQPTLALTTSGYTELTTSTLSSDGGVAGDGNLAVFYKFHNGSDTDVVATASGTGTDSSTAVQVHVYRGVNKVSPFAATITTASGTSGGDPNPPSITYAGSNVWVVAIGMVGNAAAITLSSPPANYTAPRASDVGDDTFDCAVQIAYKNNPSAPTEDPGIFTDSGAGAAWCAATLALNPAPEIYRPIILPHNQIGPPALRQQKVNTQYPNSTFFGLVGWYDASQDPVVADGTAMSTWTDRSGFGNDAPQTTGARQPLYYSNIYFSKPGILIDSTGANPSYFSIPYKMRSVLASGVCTVIMVWKWFTAPAGGTASRFTFCTDDASNSRWAFRIDNSTPSNWKTTYWNGASATQLGTVDSTDSLGHVLARTDNGVNISFQVDSNTAETASNLSQFVMDQSTESRGEFGSSTSESAKGYLAEIKIWNYPLPDATVQAEIAALTLKWLTEPIVANPTNASLVLTAFAPTVVVTANVNVTPTNGTLTTTTFAPTVATPRNVTPTNATLAITRQAPTVVFDIIPRPTNASLTITCLAPTVATPRNVVPTNSSLSITTFAPSIVVGVNVTPTNAALVVSGFAPSVATPRNVTPTNAALVLTPFAPTVEASTGTTVLPVNAALAITLYAPTVEAISSGDSEYTFYYHKRRMRSLGHRAKRKRR